MFVDDNDLHDPKREDQAYGDFAKQANLKGPEKWKRQYKDEHISYQI